MVERRRREGRPRFFTRRKVCNFCVDKIRQVDYKDVNRLRRYLSEWSKIDSRRKSGTCSRHQRQLSDAVKRARHLALLPFTADHIRTANS
ncbi:MAG: small subunit ribosomal protein S18 [Chloroflexi bacterium]|jgi:small subunit ribosomal protein S18|nr:MAG: small subunit ribosomal protein S18 [Chloroflexota bacterium]